MDQYIGKMLDDRYEILELIGTGGMANVYKARCHRLNRLVAIKILKSDLADNADFRRRFHDESQAVAQLSHANIVSVYDVSTNPDREYIVMELIDGITLKQYMERRGRMDWRESLHFITQIMRGLSHAHSRGIIHRDIKPQNIMVLRDGSVKVADFGIACLENSAQTLTQEALGSVHYISPEQARGDRADARSDIYSSGVVLYEMLTSRLPFEGESAVSVAIQHLSSIPLAPREINPDIPEALELICMKAMAQDINKRYPSADAMIADLEDFRKNPGVSMDFSLEDLRPSTDEPDEPTRLLKKTPHTAAPARPQPSHHRERDEEDDEPRGRGEKRGSGSRTALMAVGFVAALAVIFLLFRAIFASFSGGTQEFIVPKVTGYTVEDAMNLSGVKDVFEITVDSTEKSDQPAGIILSQDPKDGSSRKSDLVIHVVVSAGSEDGVMLDVTGLEVRNAQYVILKDLIKEYDLTIEQQEEYDDEIPTGNVISTIPEKDQPVSQGDTIVLVVSKGPEPVTIPSFLTMNAEKAKADAEGTYGLVVELKEVASDQPAGTVVEQSIAPNTEVPKGSAIVFSVSAAPAVRETTVDIPLPDDRATVELIVELDGVEFFNDTVDCSQGHISVKLTSTQDIGYLSYYYDGALQSQFSVSFTG
ncbi:MAG: Stk1 family PASTA domain-containing Ser/Thr kinase [Dysosmobacter sp.]|nr:Stk1 family PASTA domain-containing Ser/Thr kinase [Dysosmobacter sp.]